MYIGLSIVLLWALLYGAYNVYPNAAADIYDLLIIKMTKVWYRAVLTRCRGGDRMLDIGIGTATALVKNKDLIVSKRLVVVGIDYEDAYIKKAAKVIVDAGLGELCKVHCKSIYEPALRHVFSGAARFDCAYFSGSLTLMPDPVAALKCAAAMIVPDGVIYVTQTFQNRPSPIMERIKPLLRRFTSVDFGRVTYYQEVADIAQKAGMLIVEDGPIPGSIDNASQTARLIVLKPTSATKSN